MFVRIPKLKSSALVNPMVERIDWNCGIAFTTFGLSIGIRSNNFDVLNAIKELLPPLLLPSATLEVDRLYSVFVDKKNSPALITIELFGKLEELIHTSTLEVEVTKRTAREVLNQVALQNPEVAPMIFSQSGDKNSSTFLFINGNIVEDFDKEVSEWQFNHQLYLNSKKIFESAVIRDLLDVLESDLLLYIANWAKGFLFVHAGAVSWNNRGIIIPGVSFSGKTSLVAAFLNAGAKYYSDEYAVLDARGYLHPYPKLLSIRKDGETYPNRSSPEAYNALSGDTPVPISYILFTNYETKSRPNLTQCSKGQAILSLIKNSVSIRRQPESSIKILAKAAENAHTLMGSRGDANELVETMLNTIIEV